MYMFELNFNFILKSDNPFYLYASQIVTKVNYVEADYAIYILSTAKGISFIDFTSPLAI